jgi:hypothetical protein
VKDWTLIAKAAELGIPAADMERVGKTLDSLEESFRPLVADLTPDLEPAVFFQAEEEGA